MYNSHMEKNIEVEVRGLLSTAEYTKLKSFFADNAKKTEEKDRILIDYSTFLPGGVEERKKDIRLRVTNGIPEIIIKIGEWGGSEARKELSVKTASGTFDLLTEIFAALGYEKGTLAVRNSHVYNYKNIEFALVEVPGHSYYFEAEKMAHAGVDSDSVESRSRGSSDVRLLALPDRARERETECSCFFAIPLFSHARTIRCCTGGQFGRLRFDVVTNQ